MKIAIINGPNLNLIGKRQPEVYGNESMDEWIDSLKKKYANQEISYFQSNVEGEIINEIQDQGSVVDAIVLNPGAYSHTSVAIGDAVLSVNCKVIEVHISNIFAREDFRKHSFVSGVCDGFICGFGLKGYQIAIETLLPH